MTRRADLARLMEVAERAALAGGAVITSPEAAPTGPEEKGRAGDYVTDVDRRSERAIVEVLREETPEVSVLAEEGGGRAAERSWVVDPLDGTTNFMHGFWAVGVSVALVEGGTPTVGVVHAPFIGETFRGARGHGAERLGPDGLGSSLRVSDRQPERAVVATGFPFKNKAVLPRYLEMLGGALRAFEDLRRPGAAALDLAWAAAGVFDGFFELGLSAWDVAAGALLVEEAGGRVTDWSGGPGYLAGDILAGPPLVHSTLLGLAGGAPGSW